LRVAEFAGAIEASMGLSYEKSFSVIPVLKSFVEYWKRPTFKSRVNLSPMPGGTTIAIDVSDVHVLEPMVYPILH
jgi:hypothetical protein